VRRHLGCPYANKNVFSDRRNSPSSVSGRRSSSGKLFQIRGPAAGKLRSPKRVRVVGTMHVSMCSNCGCGYASHCRVSYSLLSLLTNTFVTWLADYMCLLVHKALIGQAPDYITILLTPVTNIPSRSSLRASSNGDLFLPRTERRIGDRAFFVAAPTCTLTMLGALGVVRAACCAL